MIRSLFKFLAKAGPVWALAIGLSGCNQTAEPEAAEADLAAADPLIAMALNDPLMVDPDLAHRNDANAALTVRAAHPLPPFVTTETLANYAREAARVELLEDGPIPDLPLAIDGAAPGKIAGLSDAGEILEAVGGPAGCRSSLKAGLTWAVDMPETATIMPHGMVQQAAGAKTADCTIRVVRYFAPVGAEDVLAYHYTRADRARLRPTVYNAPEGAIVGDGRTEHLVARVRPGPGGMSAVDLVYWTK